MRTLYKEAYGEHGSAEMILRLFPESSHENHLLKVTYNSYQESELITTKVIYNS